MPDIGSSGNSMADLAQNAQGGAANPQVTQDNSPQVSPDTVSPGPQDHWYDSVLHGILGALGGTDDVHMSRDENGNMVVSKTKSAPGTQFKRIIAGALTGLAASGGVGRGRGQKERALAAGTGAAIQRSDQSQLNARQEANEDFDVKQRETVRKAQTALLNQQLTESTWNLSRKQIDAQFGDAERENEFSRIIANSPTNKDLGVARSVDDLMSMHKDMPDLLKQQAQGNIMGIPHINDQGKIDGMHYALVTPEWKQQRIDQDETFFKLVPSGDPSKPPKLEKQVVKAGTMTNGDFFTAQQAANKEFLQYYENNSKEEGENKRETSWEKTEVQIANIHETGENARAAEANKTKEDVAAGKQTQHNIDKLDQQYVKPANDAEKSWMLADKAYQEYKSAKAQGKMLDSGAQSMQMLSQHIQTTFGQVKGARVTKDLIEKHLGARGVTDSAVVAVQKLINGDALSGSQWEAFHDMIKNVRHVNWETTVREARRKRVPIDFLPDDLRDMAAPEGATGEVFDPKDPTRLIGHVVSRQGKQQYVPLGQ